MDFLLNRWSFNNTKKTNKLFSILQFNVLFEANVCKVSGEGGFEAKCIMDNTRSNSDYYPSAQPASHSIIWHDRSD